jgi:hypothetical protein
MISENTKNALRVANPRTADRPAGDWLPAGRIIMTPYLPSNYHAFTVRLTLELTCNAIREGKMFKRSLPPPDILEA